MPINNRIRGNNVFGTTTDNPLTTASFTLNSFGLANLPVVVLNHAIITLDPLRQFGNPEIVIVISHTPSSSVATITRGAYNTSPREHPLGTLWVHAPLNEDFTVIATSLTRPLDPYHGQMIFEADTDKFVARSMANVWQEVIPLGAWQVFTPIWTQSSVITHTVNHSRYFKSGRNVVYAWSLTATGSGVATNSQTIRLPFLPAYSAASDRFPVGNATFSDSSANTFYHCLAAVNSGAQELLFYPTAAVGGSGSQFLGLSNSGGTTAAVVAPDMIIGTVTYEAAT